MNFYPKYKDYYSQFNGNGSIKDIHQSEHEMLTVLEHELLYTARKQLYTTALAVSVGVLFIHMLPLGFTDEMDTYFRVLCIGYGMYALANMMLDPFVLYRLQRCHVVGCDICSDQHSGISDSGGD